MTTYKTQFWSNDDDAWMDCSTSVEDYNDALRCFRLHSENDHRMSHRLVATMEDVVGMCLEGSELLR